MFFLNFEVIFKNPKLRKSSFLSIYNFWFKKIFFFLAPAGSSRLDSALAFPWWVKIKNPKLRKSSFLSIFNSWFKNYFFLLAPVGSSRCSAGAGWSRLELTCISVRIRDNENLLMTKKLLIGHCYGLLFIQNMLSTSLLGNSTNKIIFGGL